MKAAANCFITILRGSETNSYGDEVDSSVAVATRVAAFIIESTRRTFLPAEGATRVIRSYTGRVGAEVDLRKNDRIRNERTGRTYIVVDLAEPESGVLTPDISFTLSRTT